MALYCVNELKLKSGRALVIVAHPDDETIWMGGAILKNPQITWTIFALCRAADKDRAPKFREVCKYYGAHPIITDLEDEDIMDIRESIQKIRRLIKQKIGRQKFDYIFTHGSNGEYGHPRHTGVSRAVKSMIKNGEMRSGQLLNFAYTTDGKNSILEDKSAKFFIRLSRRELAGKRNIIKKLYGFSQYSFENLSCLPLETFK